MIHVCAVDGTFISKTRPQNIMMGLEGKEDCNPETPCMVSAFCSDLYSTNEQVVVIVSNDVYILSRSKGRPPVFWVVVFIGGGGGSISDYISPL